MMIITNSCRPIVAKLKYKKLLNQLQLLCHSNVDTDHNLYTTPPCDLQSARLFREALQKTGVNIKPILLRLKDRENAENDRSFDRISINFPLFEMEFLRNWFGNPAQGR